MPSTTDCPPRMLSPKFSASFSSYCFFTRSSGESTGASASDGVGEVSPESPVARLGGATHRPESIGRRRVPSTRVAAITGDPARATAAMATSLCTRSSANGRTPVGIIASLFDVWRVPAQDWRRRRGAHYTAIRLIPNRPTPCSVTRPPLLGARRGPAPRWQSPRRREPRLAGCPSRGWARSRGSPEPVCDWEPGVGGSAGSWTAMGRGRTAMGRARVGAGRRRFAIEQRRGRRRVRQFLCRVVGREWMRGGGPG